LHSGNEFLIALKGNQQTLLNQFLLMRLDALPETTWQAQERTRDRQIHRIVRVYDCSHQLPAEWAGVRRAICLDQVGTRKGQPYHQRRWFISSLITSAEGFAHRIRAHWGIENPLHWVKDVVFKEDQAPFTQINAAINWAIGRTFVINLLRQQGWWSMTLALQEITHDIPRLLHLTQ
jgi:predicted transposase YbfD/YdcC